MRLILINNRSGNISGDTADFAAKNYEWRDSDSPCSRDEYVLSVLAARLLDESNGTYRRSYVIGDRNDGHSGYLVYRADDNEGEPFPIDQNPAMIERDCRYVCFVETRDETGR